jgi:DNA-binding MarR family transcriptional regulator
MTGKRLPCVDENTVSLPERIATGLHKIGLAMKQQSWQQASEEGLSATQGQIMAILVAEGPLTASALSARLGVTLPTISDSVKALVEKKLVVKSPDPRHPRASLLTPTRKGESVGTRARSWPEFMADAVAELSADEQRAFYGGVVKMIRSMQEQGLVPLSGMCVSCTHFRPNVRSGAMPHHCALVDAPLAAEQLRLDCVDHAPAADELRRVNWERFTRPG